MYGKFILGLKKLRNVSFLCLAVEVDRLQPREGTGSPPSVDAGIRWPLDLQDRRHDPNQEILQYFCRCTRPLDGAIKATFLPQLLIQIPGRNTSESKRNLVSGTPCSPTATLRTGLHVFTALGGTQNTQSQTQSSIFLDCETCLCWSQLLLSSLSTAPSFLCLRFSCFFLSF